MSEPASSTNRILLIAGESQEARALISLLTDHGYAVQTTRHVDGAPKAVRRCPPDLILLSVPRSDPDALQRWLSLKSDEAVRESPVLTILPQDASRLGAMALKMGGDFVTRPLRADEILARIRFHLRQKVAREREGDARGEQLEAAARLGGLPENLREVIYEIDSDGRMSYVSPAVALVLGYSPSEVVGRTMVEFVHEEDLPRLHEAFERILSGHSATGEYRAVTRSGEVRWMHASSQPAYEGGRVTGAYGVLVDVTERKQAEHEVERLARFPSENPNPVLRIAEDGSVLYANQASEPLLDLWDAEVGEALPDEWRQFSLDVLRAGCGADAELEVGERVISLAFAPVSEAGYVNVYGLDITERKRAEEALRCSEERYALAERASNIGSWDWNIRTGELHWSGHVESMFGLAEGEFAGAYDAFLERVHPEDRERLVESVDACIEQGADYAVEHRIVWPDGTIRWVSEKGDVIRDEDGQAARMLGVVQDITERKEAEERSRRQNEFLTSVLESLTHPLYVVDVNDYTVQMANSAAYSGSLPEGATCYGLFHRQSRPCGETGLTCPVDEVKRTGEAVALEHSHYDDEGNQRNVEIRGYPVFDQEGVLTRVIEYSVDITERKRAERALQAAKDVAEEARRKERQQRQEVDRRRRAAEGLADVVAALNSNQPLDAVLHLVAEHARQLLGAQCVAICPLNGQDKSLGLALAQCALAGSGAALDSPAARRALERAVALRRPVLAPQWVSEAPERIPGPRAWGDESLRTVLVAPVIVADEPYGGMFAYYDAARLVSDDEIELAEVFGNKIALAIENTRLKEEVRRAATTAERSRLARDLHDSVTQALFSASLVADVLTQTWQRDPEEARHGLEEVRQLTRGALAEMRTLLLELRPAALMETRLDELLHQLSEAVTSRAQLSVAVSCDRSPTLPEDVHVACYRIAQEALHNVVKHAGASRLSVDLEFSPSVDDHQGEEWDGGLVLRVSDDGWGFDPRRVRGDALGLEIMRERAEVIGAELTVTSQLGEGTEVLLLWESPAARCVSANVSWEGGEEHE